MLHIHLHLPLAPPSEHLIPVYCRPTLDTVMYSGPESREKKEIFKACKCLTS